MGDVESGAIVTLIDRWNRPGHPGGLRLAAEARMRFPTGLVDDPTNLLDIGTGSGHFAGRIGGTLDWGVRRIGFRLTGAWEYVLPATRDQRVVSPSQPIAPASRLTTVRSSPGSTLDLTMSPFFQIAPGLAIQAGMRYRRHARDTYAYAPNATILPGVDPDVMGTSSDWSLTSFVAGISYTAPAVADPARKASRWRPGGTSRVRSRKRGDRTEEPGGDRRPAPVRPALVASILQSPQSPNPSIPCVSPGSPTFTSNSSRPPGSCGSAWSSHGRRRRRS